MVGLCIRELQNTIRYVYAGASAFLFKSYCVFIDAVSAHCDIIQVLMPNHGFVLCEQLMCSALAQARVWCCIKTTDFGLHCTANCDFKPTFVCGLQSFREGGTCHSSPFHLLQQIVICTKLEVTV